MLVRFGTKSRPNLLQKVRHWNHPAAGDGGYLIPSSLRFSEAQILDRDVDRPRDLLHRGHELVVAEPREKAVDDPVIVTDQPLDVLRQPHEFDAFGVEPRLLKRQIREILPGKRRPARIVV